jgi:hypothetical protein
MSDDYDLRREIEKQAFKARRYEPYRSACDGDLISFETLLLLTACAVVDAMHREARPEFYKERPNDGRTLETCTPWKDGEVVATYEPQDPVIRDWRVFDQVGALYARKPAIVCDRVRDAQRFLDDCCSLVPVNPDNRA